MRRRSALAYKPNNDERLNGLLELLREEVMREQASPLFAQSLAQAIAIYLARNYGVMAEEVRSTSPSLPGYKLRQITDWMAARLENGVTKDELIELITHLAFYAGWPSANTAVNIAR